MERPRVDNEGRYIYYASELGGCTKALVAQRMGMFPKQRRGEGEGDDPNLSPLLRVFNEGNIHEEHILKWWEEATKERVVNQQLLVELDVGIPGVIVQGHIDGETSLRVVEAKTSSHDNFKEILSHGWDTPGLVQKYKWQLSVYTFARERKGVLLFKNRNTGEHFPLLTGDEKTPGTWTPYTYDQIQERILTIEALADGHSTDIPCDFNNWPCAYEYLHTEPEKVIRKDTDIDIWAREYINATNEISRLTEVKRDAKVKVEEALGNLTKLETLAGTRVTKYKVKVDGKTSVDYEKLVGLLDGNEWGKEQLLLCTTEGGERYREQLRITVRGQRGDNADDEGTRSEGGNPDSGD